MAPKRIITAAVLLGFGLNLASCGGFVADHWPHWAGGLPADVPPRPGTPGYTEFIAHGQPTPGPQQQSTAAGAAQSGVQQTAAAPAPVAPAPPPPARAAVPDGDVTQDSSVVKGGLY